MQTKTITITASVAIINALSLVLLPVSTQKIISQNIYLKTIRESVSICLS
jgi:hypothetical protein